MHPLEKMQREKKKACWVEAERLRAELDVVWRESETATGVRLHELLERHHTLFRQFLDAMSPILRQERA